MWFRSAAAALSPKLVSLACLPSWFRSWLLVSLHYFAQKCLERKRALAMGLYFLQICYLGSMPVWFFFLNPFLCKQRLAASNKLPGGGWGALAAFAGPVVHSKEIGAVCAMDELKACGPRDWHSTSSCKLLACALPITLQLCFRLWRWGHILCSYATHGCSFGGVDGTAFSLGYRCRCELPSLWCALWLHLVALFFQGKFFAGCPGVDGCGHDSHLPGYLLRGSEDAPAAPLPGWFGGGLLFARQGAVCGGDGGGWATGSLSRDQVGCFCLRFHHWGSNWSFASTDTWSLAIDVWGGCHSVCHCRSWNAALASFS